MRTLCSLGAVLCLSAATAVAVPADYAEIQVVDSVTGRGVPLVELTTTNHQTFITDSAGRIALNEPELLGREVYFSIKSYGYEVAKDGFGFRGARLTLERGQRAEVKVTRTNIAERLCRLTGEGIYRDSEMLGKELPERKPFPGEVMGQDSVQMVRYQDKLYWFWGDTTLAHYPLGIFRTAGATSALPAKDSDPSRGIAFDYFADDKGRARNTLPLADDPDAKEGVVWIDGVIVVPDDDGKLKMVCHYERRRGLEKRLEQGLAVWNDDKKIFERAARLDIDEIRHLAGHPFLHEEQGQSYVYSGHPYVTHRVPARLSSVLDPTQYEAFNLTRDGGKIVINARGQREYKFRANLPPFTVKEEAERVARKLDQVEELHFHPLDVGTKKPITMHGGSIRYNAFRKKWILIAVQHYGSSLLGEMWYSEASAPTGPWKKTIKIASHDKYSFYNPVHHDLFDEEGGRIIYFEGTYTHTFSGNNQPTPRYEYNQILYRLDLADERLKGAW